MKPWVRWSVHVSALAIGATGALWAWMAYIWDPGAEPLDPEQLLGWSDRHPAVPLVRTLHLVVAPVAVFAVGLIWTSHVAPRLRRHRARRATGLALALLFAPMVVSGVLLQTAASSEARDLWAWVHGLSAGVWAGAYLGHQYFYFQRRGA